MRDILVVIFPEIINIAYQASIAIVVVLVVRMVLRRIHIPYRWSLWLWIVPFFRLIMPIQPESIFSLLPRESQVAPKVLRAIEKTAQYVKSGFDQRVLTIPDNVFSVHTSPVIMYNTENILYVLWLVGILILVGYSVVSILMLKKKLRISVRERDNVYLVDNISGAFVLGVLHPHIYLPSEIPMTDREQVIAHEQQHIKRWDHIFKLLVYFSCCIYWIQPFVWVAYYFVCRDMELACDEAVIRDKDEDYKKKYANALLELSLSAGKPGLVPLAFTEKSPKQRIRNIMDYKNPKRIVALVGWLLLSVVVVGFLTDPKPIEFGSRQDKLWNPQIPGLEWGMTAEEAMEHYELDIIEHEGESSTLGYTVVEPVCLYGMDMQAILYFDSRLGLFRVMWNSNCTEDQKQILQEKIVAKYNEKADREIGGYFFCSYENATNEYTFEEYKEAYKSFIQSESDASIRLMWQRPYMYHTYYMGNIYNGWLCMDASQYVRTKWLFEEYEDIK